MATTKSTNLVNIPILIEAIEAAFRGAKALYGTAAVVSRPDLPTNGVEGGKLRQGDTIKVPYFNSIGDMEDIVNEGDALTPRLLTQTGEESSVIHSGIAVELTRFARMFGSGGGDPYVEAARQFVESAMRRFDKGLIDASGTTLPAAYINDVYSAVTPVYLDWDVMVDGKLKWGDEQNNIVLMTVHSTTYGRLVKQKDSTGRPLWVDNKDGNLPVFNGVPVIVSDRMPVDTSNPTKPKYKSRIFKRGALALWFNGTPTPEEDRDILADTDVLAMHVYWVVHRYLRSATTTHPGVVEIVHN